MLMPKLDDESKFTTPLPGYQAGWAGKKMEEMVERYKAEQRKNAARIATAVRNVYAAHRM